MSTDPYNLARRATREERPEPEPETLSEWIARTGAHTALRKRRKSNPNTIAEDRAPGSSHWTVTLRNRAGRTMTVPFSQGSAHKQPPTVHDVLYCLAADVPEDGATFEDWASNYGYDTDSRKAERLFRAVERQTLDLREWAGPDFDSLRDADADA